MKTRFDKKTQTYRSDFFIVTSSRDGFWLIVKNVLLYRRAAFSEVNICFKGKHKCKTFRLQHPYMLLQPNFKQSRKLYLVYINNIEELYWQNVYI